MTIAANRVRTPAREDDLNRAMNEFNFCDSIYAMLGVAGAKGVVDFTLERAWLEHDGRKGETRSVACIAILKQLDPPPLLCLRLKNDVEWGRFITTGHRRTQSGALAVKFNLIKLLQLVGSTEQPILQCRSPFPSPPSVSFLFDCSGGHGVTPSPEDWPAPLTGALNGYAGLSPENVAGMNAIR